MAAFSGYGKPRSMLRATVDGKRYEMTRYDSEVHDILVMNMFFRDVVGNHSALGWDAVTDKAGKRTYTVRTRRGRYGIERIVKVTETPTHKWK